MLCTSSMPFFRFMESVSTSACTFFVCSSSLGALRITLATKVGSSLLRRSRSSATSCDGTSPSAASIDCCAESSHLLFPRVRWRRLNLWRFGSVGCLSPPSVPPDRPQPCESKCVWSLIAAAMLDHTSETVHNDYLVNHGVRHDLDRGPLLPVIECSLCRAMLLPDLQATA